MNTGKISFWAVPAVLAVFMAITAGFIFLHVEEMAFSLFSDDALFYAIIGRNVVDGLGSTTDGLGGTNGYHPLWAGIVVLLSLVSRNVIPLIFGVELVLGMVAVCLLYLYLARYVAPLAALALCALATVYTDFFFFMFNGMETAVVLVSLLASLLLIRRDWGEKATRWGLPVSLAMLFCARLDGGLFWVAYAATVALAGLRRRAILSTIRELAGVFAFPTVVAAVYFAANLVRFGVATPISGRIKAIPLHGLFEVGPDHFARLVKLWMPNLLSKMLNAALGWQFHDAGLVTVGAILAVAALVVGVCWRLHGRGQLDSSLVCLILYSALHSCYYVFCQRDTYSLDWAKVPEMILVYLAGAAAIGGTLSLARHKVLSREGSLAIACLLAAAWFGHGIRVSSLGQVRDFSVASRDFREALAYIENETADTAILASHNIGFLGYYSKRRIISVDGLINSPEYYYTYRLPRREWTWMKRCGVSCLVESVAPGDDALGYLLDLYRGLNKSDIKMMKEFNAGAGSRGRHIVVAHVKAGTGGEAASSIRPAGGSAGRTRSLESVDIVNGTERR